MLKPPMELARPVGICRARMDLFSGRLWSLEYLYVRSYLVIYDSPSSDTFWRRACAKLIYFYCMAQDLWPIVH